MRPIEETAMPIQMTHLNPPLCSGTSSGGTNVGSLTFRTTKDTKSIASIMKIPGPGPKELKLKESNQAKMIENKSTHELISVCVKSFKAGKE